MLKEFKEFAMRGRWVSASTDRLDARDCAVTDLIGGRTLPVATIARDPLSLQTEASMEGKQ